MNYLGAARLVLGGAVLMGAAGALCLHANAADMPVKAPPAATYQAAGDVNSSVLWLGSDFKNRVSAGNIGGIYAFSGNLDAPGWLVRGQFTYVDYDFNTTQAANGTGNGKFYQGSAAVGYQIVGSSFVASGLVGLDAQKYNINPVSATPIGIGDKIGVAFYGRVATKGGAQFPSAIDGNFSTANNSYWVRGRTGVRFGAVTVGPELIGLGNRSFDEVRVGGYVAYDITSKWIVHADLGYADGVRGESSSAGRGGTGVYGGVTLIFLH
jgi:hypothetical protein